MNGLTKRVGLLAASLVALAAPGAWAEGWGVDLAFRSGRPAALETGQVLGASASLTAGDEGLRWGVRLGWATTEESTLTWAVAHHELRVLGTFGVGHRDGVGLLHAALGVGTTFVLESRERHQSARLSADGQAVTSDGWLIAPLITAEVGVSLDIYDRWRLTLAGGPELHLVPPGDDGGSVQARLGWSVLGGFGRSF